MDVNSQNGNKLEIKLRESQPTVNQLTQQIKELQEVVKSLKGVSSLQRTARQQVAQGLSTLQANHEFFLAFLASLAAQVSTLLTNEVSTVTLVTLFKTPVLSTVALAPAASARSSAAAGVPLHQARRDLLREGELPSVAEVQSMRQSRFVCKHYTSKYRKMATKILRRKQWQRYKSYENEVNENYSITSKTGTTRTPTSRPQSTTPMTTLTSTIAWRKCTESARTAHLFHSCDCLTLHIPWLKS